MIDYIFFSRQSMRTLGLLGSLDMDWLKSNRIVGFPHPHIPSDHLPLIVELELFTNNMSTNQQQQQQQQNHQHQQHPQQLLHHSMSVSNQMRTNQHSSTSSSHHHSLSGSHINMNGTSNQMTLGQMLPVNANQSQNNSTNGNFNYNFMLKKI